MAFHLGEVAGVDVEGGRDDGGADQDVVVAEEVGAAVDYRAASEFGAGYVLRAEREAVFDVQMTSSLSSERCSLRSES